MLKVQPEVSETGSIAVYARVWRSAPFPDGILLYEFREIQLPMNRREQEAAWVERWRSWNSIMEIVAKNHKK